MFRRPLIPGFALVIMLHECAKEYISLEPIPLVCAECGEISSTLFSPVPVKLFKRAFQKRAFQFAHSRIFDRTAAERGQVFVSDDLVEILLRQTLPVSPAPDATSSARSPSRADRVVGRCCRPRFR